MKTMLKILVLSVMAALNVAAIIFLWLVFEISFLAFFIFFFLYVAVVASSWDFTEYVLEA